jgi:protein-tyrosine-phosphatase/2-polyprenyl-3-methyl-5-hydroxy-6-metoxy-1,4-benzoquinol methylase
MRLGVMVVTDTSAQYLREQVRSRYAQAARAVLAPAEAGSAGCFGGALYGEGETDGLPEDAVLASLGCGNPLAVADLREGERVLDLGSGGGIDVLLSARRVGPSGFAYGVDMTDDMLALARANAARAGARNVEFLKGEIEALPLPAGAVDVVISNCVINLSTDKPAVLAEMFRVLAPGGRIGVSDVVAEDHLTREDRAAAGSYVGCIAGALSRQEYLDGLASAGFAKASVTFTHEAAPGMHAAIIRAVRPASVLFVCTHNAGRSQMAAALLDHEAGGRVRVRSAGSQPASQLNPAVVQAMAEIGLDLSREFPKPLTSSDVQAADVVITMGCGDACPVYPGKRYLNWDLPDPAGLNISAIRPIRDNIRQRVLALLGELAA